MVPYTRALSSTLSLCFLSFCLYLCVCLWLILNFAWSVNSVRTFLYQDCCKLFATGFYFLCWLYKYISYISSYIYTFFILLLLWLFLGTFITLLFLFSFSCRFCKRFPFGMIMIHNIFIQTAIE